MTLSDAIKNFERRAKEQEQRAEEHHQAQLNKCATIPFAEMDYTYENACRENAREYKQIANWLKELKGHRLAYSQIKFNACYFAGGRGEAFSTSADIIDDKVKKEKNRAMS